MSRRYLLLDCCNVATQELPDIHDLLFETGGCL